jgi:glycosyltransferase involved in cell wall biosynthesis
LLDIPVLRLILIMPVCDDWFSAAELTRRLDQAIPSQTHSVRIMFIDDGSLEKCPPQDFRGPFSVVKAIDVLRLRRNLGHQRAIATGLAYVHAHLINSDAVVVMDADGEDTPEGVVRLLEAYTKTQGNRIIFARRGRRSESLLFRSCYHIYRYLHHGLTGISVRVGNFSILPWESINTLVAMSELWNHYAAAIFRSRLALSMVPIARGPRIAGRSTMNFASLVSHGLSAMSVFSDVIGVRLLIGSLSASVLCGFGIVAVVLIRLLTNLAIPGWATYATGALTIILIQLLTIAASFTFFMLSNRTNLGFVPFRDYSLFTEDVVRIFP